MSHVKQRLLCRERDPEVRFWMQIKSSKNDCWEYASHRAGPYRQNLVHGKMLLAHRYSYELHFGPIPDGVYVCHHCDNPKCVRPDHLFVGTPQDNQDDAIRKRRTSAGSKNSQARLSEDDIKQVFVMRRNGMLQKEIAVHFGTGSHYIGAILNGKVWSCLGIQAISGRLNNPPPQRRKKGPKLTAVDVLQMHHARACGLMVKEIAKLFGVSKVTACDILRGKYWKHVYDEYRQGASST